MYHARQLGPLALCNPAMKVPFTKYHGIGNDFILLGSMHAEPSPAIDAETAQRLCDRHFGVGADGVLCVVRSERADRRMLIYNADGSIPEMCGNGIRCFTKHLVEHGVTGKETLAIETGRGVLECSVQRSGDGQVTSVAVQMGAPILEPKLVPVESDATGPFELDVDGTKFRVHPVSMGNPHAIVFDRGSDIATAEKFGPAIEKHARFPKKTNVEFATVRDREHIDVAVWERGCGITLACGTGACATVVAAALQGLVDFDREVTVKLPGGELAITVAKDLSGVRMRGAAVAAFAGEVEI